MAKTNAEIKISLIDGVSAGLSKIQKSVSGVTASLAATGAAAVATAASIAAIGFGAALVDGIKGAATFEQSLDRISSKSGIAGEELAALGDTIKSIAQDASRTGDEGAAAFLKLTEEGLSAAEAIKALPDALNFATTSTQAMDAAVGGLTDTLAVFNLGTENIGRAADVLTVGALKAGTGVADLQAQLIQLGPTASDVGLTLEGTAASLGTLAANGIEGGRGAKALAQILDQLRDPASKFRDELRKIGIDSGDFNTVLAQLELAGPKAAGALNALGINGTAALKALSKDGGDAVRLLTAELGNVDGATSKAAEAVNANLVGAFNRAQEAFNQLRQEFVEPLLGPLADEFDAIAVKLRDFVASPEFESLRQDFKAAFLEALDAAKKFVAEFDFSAAVKAVQDFTQQTTAALGDFKEFAQETATAVKAVGNTIASAFNAIQTATAAAATGSARLFENITGFFGNFSDQAKEVSANFKNLADVAEKETGVQAAQLADNLAALAENFGTVADQTDAATTAQQDAIPVTQQLSEDQIRAANNAKVLADAELAHAEASKVAAAEAQALALDLDKLGNVKPITAVAVGAESAATSFGKVQAEIQASIDASKQLAGGVREVADAAQDAGSEVADLGNQLDRDLGDAVLRGLTEGFGRVKRDLAELRGVSEDVVAGELTNALQGATNTMVGLNNAIKAGDAAIEKLGGQKALQKLRDDAKAAAEAIAQIGQNPRSAPSDLEAMVRSLQDANDARNGDQASIEQRRFDEELARINELERVSGGTARVAAAQARELARKNHEARLAEIRAEGDARVASELDADARIANARSAAAAPAATTGQLGAAPGGKPLGPSANPPANVNIAINLPEIGGDINQDAFARKLGASLKRLGIIK